MKDIKSIIKISFQDILHEFWPSVLAVVGLAGILTPLLILFSLKYGIIASMSDRLLASPVYREIQPEKHQNFTPEWFVEMRGRKAVGFITPSVYFLTKHNVPLTNPEAKDSEAVYVDVTPTAPGDPVLQRWHLAVRQKDEAVLSFYAAKRLKIIDEKHQASAPPVLKGNVTIRMRIANADSVEQRLIKIVGVLPKSESKRTNNQIYVSLSLLNAIDEFKNKSGQGKSIDDLLRQDEKDRIYKGFRLYARTLQDVARLVEALEAQEIPVSSQIDRIREMEQIDTILVMVFLVVAGIGALGFLLATAVNLLANVARKQRELSILRLLGYSSWAIAIFPAVQSVLTAVTGSLLAWGLYFLTLPMIEMQFKDNIRLLFGYRIVLEDGSNLMRLYPAHFFIAMGLTVLVSLIASAAAGIKAAHLMPAEGIRYD